MSLELEVADPQARTNLLSPLRSSEFRLLWAGLSASFLANALSAVALAWLALQVTGSPLALGGILTAMAVPRGVLGLLGGTVSDRLGPRRVGLVTSLVRGGAMGVLAVLVLLRMVNLAELYGLAVAVGACDAFFNPSRSSLIPHTVPSEQLEAATSLEGATQSLTSFLGPAVAGVVVARFGTGYAIGADALLYGVVAWTTWAMRTGTAPLPGQDGSESSSGLWADLLAGVRYVLRDPGVRMLMLVAAAVAFCFEGPIEVGLASLARTRLGGPTGLGLMLAGFGAGLLGGTLLAGAIPGKRVGPRVIGTLLVLGLVMPLLGVVPNLAAAVAVTLVFGLAGGQVNVTAMSWLMRRTDPAMLGRVFSVSMVISVAAAPLSFAGAGALAQVSVPLLFLLSGGLLLVVAAATAASRTIRAA